MTTTAIWYHHCVFNLSCASTCPSGMCIQQHIVDNVRIQRLQIDFHWCRVYYVFKRFSKIIPRTLFTSMMKSDKELCGWRDGVWLNSFRRRSITMATVMRRHCKRPNERCKRATSRELVRTQTAAADAGREEDRQTDRQRDASNWLLTSSETVCVSSITTDRFTVERFSGGLMWLLCFTVYRAAWNADAV